MLNGKLIKLLLIIIIAVAMDQITKYLVLNFFTHHNGTHAIEVGLFLNIVLVWNHGISFGMFNDLEQSQIILISVSLVIVAGLIIWLIRSDDNKVLFPIALIIGGALGNIIDRIQYGAVVDFIDFYFKQYHYPAFNLADSFIVIGVLILMIQSFQEKEQNRQL
ncbi:Lipoprotein signal peptidase [endosymbiont of Acanthamoeba sp. UWC8]|uniref:signal peptidase II n=1 Tax=endosymbiont of Acanthamoeba sp. UWC8 TaxID=86106 RepID=UPI0004D19F26|nr:signal peptidase II [endosymbiont of Acanthamoeba sp. UWC8]AIF81372.1 Lipoprotein signal peptidase [endosymbiont of Acanthamoeba sp. UWC8]